MKTVLFAFFALSCMTLSIGAALATNGGDGGDPQNPPVTRVAAGAAEGTHKGGDGVGPRRGGDGVGPRA